MHVWALGLLRETLAASTSSDAQHNPRPSIRGGTVASCHGTGRGSVGGPLVLQAALRGAAQRLEKLNQRLQLEHEVRLMEQIAEGDSVGCEKEGWCPSQEPPRPERVIDHEQQVRWRSKDSEVWNRNPRSCGGRIVSDGSLRRDRQ